MTPTNISIAAAEGAERFAYVGDYSQLVSRRKIWILLLRDPTLHG